MAFVAIHTPYNIYLDFEIAPLHKRIIAWLIDISVIVLYSYALRSVLGMISGTSRYPVAFDLLLVSLPMLFYPLLMEIVFDGQSLGKIALSLRVLSLEGGEPGIGQYLMRWIFRIWEWPLIFGAMAYNTWNILGLLIATFMVGIIVLVVVAVSPKGQRLGDLAAGTTVVNLRQRFSLADTVFREVMPHNYKVLFPNVMTLSDRDINAIKSVILQTRKTGKYQTAFRIAAKVKEVLHISNDDDVLDFLEKLLADYNYLATKE